jgi:hypothetical protein
LPRDRHGLGPCRHANKSSCRSAPRSSLASTSICDATHLVLAPLRLPPGDDVREAQGKKRNSLSVPLHDGTMQGAKEYQVGSEMMFFAFDERCVVCCVLTSRHHTVRFWIFGSIVFRRVCSLRFPSSTQRDLFLEVSSSCDMSLSQFLFRRRVHREGAPLSQPTRFDDEDPTCLPLPPSCGARWIRGLCPGVQVHPTGGPLAGIQGTYRTPLSGFEANSTLPFGACLAACLAF